LNHYPVITHTRTLLGISNIKIISDIVKRKKNGNL
jgi:hypothetical protein